MITNICIAASILRLEGVRCTMKKMVVFLVLSCSIQALAGGGSDNHTSVKILNCTWLLDGNFRKVESDEDRPQWIRLLDDSLYQVRFQPEPFDLDFVKKISDPFDIYVYSGESLKLTEYKNSLEEGEPPSQFYVVEGELGAAIFSGFNKAEFVGLSKNCIDRDVVNELK